MARAVARAANEKPTEGGSSGRGAKASRKGDEEMVLWRPKIV